MIGLDSGCRLIKTRHKTGRVHALLEPYKRGRVRWTEHIFEQNIPFVLSAK
jgi:hypothetical protein